jgi:hypothetical protein
MILLVFRQRNRRTARRARQPIKVTGLTLEHVATGLKYRFCRRHARSLAEAIHTALDESTQVAAAGWIVRRNGRQWELDGRQFDFPLTRLTREQAVYIGTALAQVQRMEVA